MTNYHEVYTFFYTKYYNKAELLIKHYLIKNCSQEKSFVIVFNEVFQYLSIDCVQKMDVHKNENLKPLYSLFENRNRFYSKNQEQNIFENKIKNAFDAISKAGLPKEYSFSKLIIDISILQATNEITRVFSNNFHLISMFYQLNQFDQFEIRTYDPISVEDSPIYKKLQAELYPKNEASSDTDSAIPAQKNEKTTDKSFNRNYWNENCFELFYYLQDNYSKKGKIKHINIFYFLKNHVDKNNYTFAFTIEQYKDFIQMNFSIQITKFSTAEYDFKDKEIPILKSFEQDFRYRN